MVASTPGVGERTLTRLCAAELGMTFPQWRTQLRLHHALRLPAEGAHTPGAHRAVG
ncbi:hypothetical protein SMF913_26448 [Streptomyces malaysiensis]|uniref:HTH araC/xylS-type domain-containing protein n=1 Tax=Streptomyces malaysiensis TaxID=92644 RepID=A0A2J7YSH1_STRMQ|nr:hypothetical protein SMF913_26448 [Streptomyces malaysiensis]